MPPRAKAAPKKDPYATDIFEPDTTSSDDESLGDEAQTDLPPWAGPDNTDKKENKVDETNQTQGKITVTLKGGNDFSQPWVVIHGKDPADLLETFDDPGLVEVLTRTRRAAEFFAGTKPAVTPTQNTTAPTSAPQGASQAPGGAKFCAHGEMQYKTGFSQKTQKTWSGHFCPTPQGTPGQCPPQFGK